MLSQDPNSWIQLIAGSSMRSLYRALISLLMFALTGCAVNTPIPATATSLPQATSTPAVAPTLTPSPTLQTRYAGPLSQAQRDLLNQVAQGYIAETPEEAVDVAVRLGYLGSYGTAEMVCGPLSLAILQGSGLVDPDVPLLDFFYLNPRPGQDDWRLKKVFPEESFEKIEIEEPINQIDYTRFPLYAGDFLYLFAGDSGSFEHMLVVSRVDETGRAYSVTNFPTAEGYMIREVMLYDPNNPGVGQFYDWTNREFMDIGRTGYGGFWLWRLKSPQN